MGGQKEHLSETRGLFLSSIGVIASVLHSFLKKIFPLGDVDRLTGEHSVSGASMRKCCIIRLKYR
jgi:hypothetical protein